MAKLTEKQILFCEEYLTDLNGTKAAIRAGYSPKRASEQAYQLLQKTPVQERIEELKEERRKGLEITQEKVLLELANIAFSNATDYVSVVEKEAMVEIEGQMVPVMDKDGNPVKYRTVEPVLTENLTADQKKALADIRKGRDGFVVKPYDKVQALKLLGQHLGMFTDNVNVSGTVNNPMEGLTTEELKKLIYDG